MGSGKALHQSPPPTSYRDELDYAETASMSSAVLLDDVEAAFPDEELPPYQDIPADAPLIQAASTPAASRQTWNTHASPFYCINPYANMLPALRPSSHGPAMIYIVANSAPDSPITRPNPRPSTK